MRKGWTVELLGDLVRKRTDFTQVNPEAEYRILGVQRSGWGFVEKRLHGRDMKFKKLMGVSQDNLVYRTITAFEAPCSVASTAQAGAFVTPQTFPVYSIDITRLLPSYMALTTTLPSFHQAMAERCTGSVLRRKTLAPRAFESIPIPIPPLPEQRRIVDLIGALDEVITRHESSLICIKVALASARNLSDGAEGASLGELSTMRSGPSWKSADESIVPQRGAIPVLGIVNTPVGTRIDLVGLKYVSGLPQSVQLLDRTSLVMIRTNGNRSRIGNIYRATPEVEGFAVSAFQIAIRPKASENRDYLYWYLGSEPVQRAITENASGTTGLGNIAVGWLKQLHIPELDAAEKRQYVERCEALSNTADEQLAVLRASRKLRSTLLTVLLSGEHEIPESYDELMGV